VKFTTANVFVLLLQLGGGIWAGCLAMATGIIGILASAREWCPLKSTPQKITHTIFLALSLVSLAVAQLVVALAATGAARDINNSEYEVDEVEVCVVLRIPQESQRIKSVLITTCVTYMHSRFQRCRRLNIIKIFRGVR
jgi:hypothetical protein